MMNPLGSLRALLMFLTMALQSRLPTLSVRRGITQFVAIIFIIIIIIIGGAIIYIVITSTGVTITTYP